MENSVNKRLIAPPSEMYRTSRGQIEFFDNAINQRVIWLSIGQSFFFGVYATLVSIKAPTPELLAKQKILTNILPVAAFFTALFTLFDVISSLRYMMGLLKNYNEKAKNLAGDKLYPYLWGKPTDRIFQHGSPTIIPVVFIVAWIIMMLYTYNFL